jgi:hypothetical protein
VRIAAVFAVLLSLAACNRGDHSKEALRQGVMDHLASSSLGLNMAGMDVALNDVRVKGDEADVTASITPKGGPSANGMSIQYHLQQRNNKWVVTGRNDAGGSPHGGAMAPATGANPHGGAMPGAATPGAAPSQMPSPNDLPPTPKK